MKLVFEAQGKQWNASAGDSVILDRLEGKEGDIVEFPHVLMTIDGDKVQVGTPYVEGVTVKAQIVRNLRAKKIRVLKFESKINYHVVHGHRQDQTEVRLTESK
ncbi:50S ribosomal protein L21 [Candidatus Wirthbacteria bacterium CG2_30_54_11]|uniref:Large ribosomal subunit protein bL21 n=1 Tax=Candidatus Wirthbacteria bacterium CG2_30_54_11 TaxID=1817892 RepID=A0A1J5J104_9BACT|nr:MAG: 50S ribosomal protein L21 [Candidatus Wirthbacteria bacterium CG2_30_54_11]